VTGCTVPYEIEDPRDGDPSELIANNNLAKTVLNWNPRFIDLEEIISHVWKWEKRIHISSN
jgi:UDP-glucose 4-epimerase